MLVSRLYSLEGIGLDRASFPFLYCIHTFLHMMTPKRKTLTFHCIVSFFFFPPCIYVCMKSFEQKHPQTREELSTVRLMTKAFAMIFLSIPKPFIHPRPYPFFHSFDRRPSKSLAVSSSLLFLLSFLLLSFFVFIPLASFLPLPSKRISYRGDL